MSGVIIGIILLILLISLIIFWTAIRLRQISNYLDKSKLSEGKKILIVLLIMGVTLVPILMAPDINANEGLNRYALYLIVIPIGVLVFYLIDKDKFLRYYKGKKKKQELILGLIVMSSFFIVGICLLIWTYLKH